MRNKKKNQGGFTLVELAIVLVIIGLIVGGVLVGQDLIKAATIRATVTDIEKFNAASTTFKGKFTGYPGDLVNTRAVEFGYNTTATDTMRDGTPGKGDGNGLLEGGGPSTTNILNYETALFWYDLGKAGLIPSHSNLTSASAITATNSLLNPNLGNGILPRTKLRDSTLFTIFSMSGRNFYGLSTFATDGSSTLALTAGLTPLEARGIDDKLDDGSPLTGIVEAITAMTTTGTTPDVPVTAGSAGCVAGTAAANTYNGSTDTLLNAIACSISVRASF